ncbi:hypothetical protein RvY_14483 [Ramazzottius varieornatus]|uniref:Uncharacterized protein n=1 Tax=Ramazzottius varieornatus TaxID=947166 RepID=A0A1D1VRH0_RAMVA|nr:hypothetical protein RvY_14483 [Ramazzottius varieornatus]
MICFYIAELVRGESPANTMFCDDQSQRQLLHTLLESEKFVPCPRRRGRKSSDGLTNRKADMVITVDQSVAIRNRLGSMPNRPIHGCKRLI